MADYLTAAELKATLSLDTAFADADIALAITAASRSIDSHCGRRFWLDDEETTRIFFAAAWDMVGIDDLAVADDVDILVETKSNGVWTELTVDDDYQLCPPNAAVDGEPYTLLVADSPLAFSTGSVRVTGLFGWAAIPVPVIQATALLASRLMKRSREAPFGVAGFGMDGGVVRIAGSDPDVAALLAPLRRNVVMVA